MTLYTKTGTYFKAAARFLKLEYDKYLGYGEISATGCDPLNIFFFLCSEATWVSVLVGLTCLGKKLCFPQQFLILQGLVLVEIWLQLYLHWWQALRKDVCDRCLIFWGRFCLLVDDHDCTKKPLFIYCTSQMIVFSLSNNGFLLCNEKNLFYILCFYFKNISLLWGMSNNWTSACVL